MLAGSRPRLRRALTRSESAHDEVAAPTKSLTLALAALVICASTCLAGRAQAQSAGGVAHAGRPVAHATAIDDHPILDGRLDEQVWGRARPITEFTQLDPEEGRPASARTQVRIVYDAEALYIGA